MATERTSAQENELFEHAQHTQPTPEEPGSRPARRKCNELDGRTWLQYSISVWDDIKKSTAEIRLGHPAMFPTMLVHRLIQMFLRADQTVVLDPFVGSGSTVIGALQEGKIGIGLDVSPDYIKQARERCRSVRTLWDDSTRSLKPVLKVADSRNLLSHVDPNSVDLCITSPPYWDILKQKRTADYKEIRNYGDRQTDLGTIQQYDAFFAQLASVFRQVFLALKPNSYCVVIVMDLRKKNHFFPFHSDVAQMMETIGFVFDDLIIWNRKSEYNNLRPLGYPAVFRVNKVHEFILFFKTPDVAQKRQQDGELSSLR